ncbi:ubiquitin-protein ligase/ zinc ion binding protein [Tribonema minus]|uniref:Ubiquitin-protein ligase/ zinc ion binding protein n=1 Tax=Tribonema minus TaxID=303371 RepID=A0A836CGW1_9STRA|nr:ubiquitin-protein ligase/ zinc ion binding protein [Tribonema minus]
MNVADAAGAVEEGRAGVSAAAGGTEQAAQQEPSSLTSASRSRHVAAALLLVGAAARRLPALLAMGVAARLNAALSRRIAYFVNPPALLAMGAAARRVARLNAALSRRVAGAGARVEMVTRTQWESRMLARHPQLANGGRLALLLMDRDFDGDDYQMLLELDADNVAPAAVGATEAEIRRNPCFTVQESDAKQLARSCSICLHTFCAGEEVRIVPCLHQYHSECIDEWLRMNATCPICKFPAVG